MRYDTCPRSMACDGIVPPGPVRSPTLTATLPRSRSGDQSQRDRLELAREGLPTELMDPLIVRGPLVVRQVLHELALERHEAPACCLPSSAEAGRRSASGAHA